MSYNPHNKTPQETALLVINLAESGLNGMAIATQLGIGKSTVYRILKSYPGYTRPSASIESIDKDKVFELYNSGLSIRQIAKSLGCSCKLIDSALKQQGIMPVIAAHRCKDEIIADYNQNHGLRRIAKKFHSSRSTIKKVLEANGITVKRRSDPEAMDAVLKARAALCEARRNNIIEAYKSRSGRQKRAKTIAKNLSLHPKTVSKYLKLSGIASLKTLEPVRNKRERDRLFSENLETIRKMTGFFWRKYEYKLGGRRVLLDELLSAVYPKALRACELWENQGKFSTYLFKYIKGAIASENNRLFDIYRHEQRYLDEVKY